jgi:putative membrane protein
MVSFLDARFRAVNACLLCERIAVVHVDFNVCRRRSRRNQESTQMKKYLAYTAVAVPLLFSGVAVAQNATTPPAAPPSIAATPPVPPTSQVEPTSPAPATAADLSPADKAFVTKAAQGGLAEVQMAQLAQQKASSDDVKKFAQTMIDDHTPNNEQLVKLATAKGLTPPTDPNAMQQKMLAHLQGLSGAKFDKAYVKIQVRAHTMMLKEMRMEAQRGKDADLKNFAEQTSSTVEHHLSMAQDLQKSGA